ncbi:MAG TPA: nodulation protein NfeD [Gaiellales bacterium]|nr:nodulation protein NfeD [Gaiellales bacterium]
MPRRILIAAVAALALVAGATTAGPARAAGNQPLVLAMRLDTEINPVSANFVKDSISKAESEHAAALVILMDTPGGDSDSMNQIIQAELASKVAVIVYVSPEGARAASAGAFITMGSDLAAMAPTTHIGAATPIDASGQNLGSDLRRKVLHDAVAQITSLANSHGRNAHAARLMVTNASEFTASQALHKNLIENVARSLPVLLGQIDGTTTYYKQKPIVLHTADAHIETIDMPWTLRLLNILIDPNLLYLLFLAGIMGIAYEVFHPGVILPGTLGAVSLILALFGFSVVSINLAGVVLMILGVALLGMEAWVSAHGLMGISGVIAIAAGGLMLFRTPGEGVSPFLVVGMSVVAGVLLAFVATKVVAARHSPVTSGGGALALVGRTAVVRTRLQPHGQVYLHGELWQAETAGDDVEAGREVVVEAVDGLTLRVIPAPAPTTEGVAT